MFRSPHIFYFLIIPCFLFSCKKEHLDPAPPSQANSSPLVFITTKMDGDSVYFAGGVNGYTGSTDVLDTINSRIFNFLLQQNAQPLKSAFKISINNYINGQGDPQEDLDSSIFISTRNYGSGLLFVPLAAGITWYDSAGTAYKSVPANPNSFSINSVEEIEHNSKQYKKATISFECFLVYNFTDSIHLTDGEATILFSTD